MADDILHMSSLVCFFCFSVAVFCLKHASFFFLGCKIVSLYSLHESTHWYDAFWLGRSSGASLTNASVRHWVTDYVMKLHRRLDECLSFPIGRCSYVSTYVIVRSLDTCLTKYFLDDPTHASKLWHGTAHHIAAIQSTVQPYTRFCTSLVFFHKSQSDIYIYIYSHLVLYALYVSALDVRPCCPYVSVYTAHSLR